MEKEKNLKTLMACRYCPMCRQVCTSGNLSKHESDFPRGRGLILYNIFNNTSEYNKDFIDSIYNCFLCGRCMVNCEGKEYNIPDMIKEARQDIVELKKEPEIIGRIKDSIIRNENPYGLNNGSGFKSSLKEKAEILYYMGPEINYKNHEIAESVFKIFDAANLNYTVLKDEPDCGKILSNLGYFKEATEKAKDLFQMIKNSNCKTLVVSCPLCYDAFKNDYPEWGLKIEPDIKIYHISEFIKNLISDGKIKVNKINEKITLADSEYLCIFNNIFDEPRELMELSAGEKFVPMWENCQDALSTGEAAIYFKGNTDTVGEEICQDICKRAKEIDVKKIITLSATAKNNLKSCLDFEVIELSELVSRFI